MPRKRKIHRQQSVCDREPCGLRHSPFAACADGFRKRIPFQRASSSTEPVAAPPSVEPESAAVAAAAPNLALITDPDELAKYMPADLARELAERRQNDQIEKDWHAAEAATGMPLVRPARLRKKSAAAAAE
ncbi:MAG TPA: hypothetical protein VGS17_00680, partial [Candidatus Limnocylindria bacterium]|nr:hypothetical protein [Candidatus Limnocylindria bacterium]